MEKVSTHVGLDVHKRDIVVALLRAGQDDVSLAVFLGPLKGVPYKLYAAQAPTLGVGLASLLLVTVPARLFRFILISAIAGWASRRLLVTWNVRKRALLFLALWVVFYVFYGALA